MKKIIPLIEKHKAQQQKTIYDKVSIKEIKIQLLQTKDLLNELRVKVRETKFNNKEEEIIFFKYTKPEIYANFIVLSNQLDYLINRPNTTYSILKNYVLKELKKLENKKRKNKEFYKYYKQDSTYLDHIYFTRENQQLEIFTSDLLTHLDVEFYTSHDTLAAEVLAYDILTGFYKKEIQKIEKLESGLFEENSKVVNNSFEWTTNKTDLVELIYSLKVSGAINYGNISTKEMVEMFSSFFNIELPNFYKTYTEIKSRNKERTKFLNKLADNLQEKLDYDDGL